jgi:glycosyltransferase involved in cell wall biosynthesis
VKIFHIVTLSELGGAQTVVAHLANTLSAGHEVTVFAGDGDNKLFPLLNPRVKRFKVTTLVQKVSPLNDIRTFLFFAALRFRDRPDIVHLHSSKAGALGRLAFPARNVVYTVHGFDSIRLAHRKFLFLERRLQKKCKAIVAVSRYDEEKLKREGITRNISCIYNGVPYPPPPARRPRELPVPGKYTGKILCVARVGRQKRLDLFLETARRLPDYAFIWIGNREDPPSVPENVFLLGNLPRAAEYNRMADLFMLPSNYEGLPVVILEAMSYGKPVVASAVGGVPELVEDGVTGCLSENDAGQFAGKVRALVDNRDLYTAISRNVRDRLRRDFTVEKMTSEYLKIYTRGRPEEHGD